MSGDVRPDAASNALHFRCPAKLNLCLGVGRPVEAAAGRHPVVSAMAALDFGDDLQAKRRPGGGLRLHREWAGDAPSPSPIDWPAPGDLVWRAAEAFAHAAEIAPDVEIDLRKRVPCGGGLGGGSADAAATLLAMDALWPGRLDADRLAGLASGLGSDVTFALAALRGRGFALVGGFGEDLQPMGLPGGPPLHAALVFPAFGCPTGPVFDALDRSRAAGPGDNPVTPDAVRHAARDGWAAVARLGNDLAAPACRVRPALGLVLQELREAGLDPRITGSGSAVFVLTEDAPGAEAAAARAQEATGLPTRVVSGTPLADPPR